MSSFYLLCLYVCNKTNKKKTGTFIANHKQCDAVGKNLYWDRFFFIPLYPFLQHNLHIEWRFKSIELAISIVCGRLIYIFFLLTISMNRWYYTRFYLVVILLLTCFFSVAILRHSIFFFFNYFNSKILNRPISHNGLIEAQII